MIEKREAERQQERKINSEISLHHNQVDRTQISPETQALIAKLLEEINSKPPEVSQQVLPKQVPLALKSDWKEFETVLQRNDVQCFYHFTDKANLSSIKQHKGLCSWKYCDDNNIKIVYPGGSELSRSLDKRDRLQNYVRISFTKEHPMMFQARNEGRIQDPVILEISTKVALWINTKFSDRNATRNGANIGGGLSALRHIRFDLVKKRKHFDIEDVNEHHFYQAELSVLEKIPIEYITNFDSFQVI